MVETFRFYVTNLAIGHFYLHFVGIGNRSNSSYGQRIIPVFQQFITIFLLKA